MAVAQRHRLEFSDLTDVGFEGSHQGCVQLYGGTRQHNHHSVNVGREGYPELRPGTAPLPSNDKKGLDSECVTSPFLCHVPIVNNMLLTGIKERGTSQWNSA